MSSPPVDAKSRNLGNAFLRDFVCRHLLSYLPEFEDFAHGVAGVPRNGEGPDALSAEAEEADKEIRHAERRQIPLNNVQRGVNLFELS